MTISDLFRIMLLVGMLASGFVGDDQLKLRRGANLS
jgi:hypothetical protein